MDLKPVAGGSFLKTFPKSFQYPPGVTSHYLPVPYFLSTGTFPGWYESQQLSRALLGPHF